MKKQVRVSSNGNKQSMEGPGVQVQVSWRFTLCLVIVVGSILVVGYDLYQTFLAPR